jgi:hypothetical protein
MKSSGIRYAIASLLGFHECRSATSRRLPRRPVTYIAMPRRAIGEKSGDEALSPPKIAAVGI